MFYFVLVYFLPYNNCTLIVYNIIIILHGCLISMAVREVNVRVLGKGLELLSANAGRFEINQLLFADDTALVSDSDEKLCRLV